MSRESGEKNLYSFLKGKRVLVTGAGGFIGSHLTEALVEAGASVRAMVKYNGRRDPGKLLEVTADKLSEVEIQFGDIRDPFFVDQVVQNCDVVFHLAALIGIPYSYVAPADYISTNVSGTLNVLQACQRHGVERVLQTSTSEVYGSAVETPMSESHRLHPQSPYAASKVAADALALSFYRSFETPVVVVRPFNTYGPRQSLRAVIPTILHQLLTAEQVELGSTSPQRDLTYVADTAKGFMALACAPAAVGRSINLGTQTTTSIADLVELCIEVTGIEKPLVSSEERVRPAKSEVDCLLANAELASELANWRSSVDLATGIAKTAEYVRNCPAPMERGYVI